MGLDAGITSGSGSALPGSFKPHVGWIRGFIGRGALGSARPPWGFHRHKGVGTPRGGIQRQEFGGLVHKPPLLAHRHFGEPLWVELRARGGGGALCPHLGVPLPPHSDPTPPHRPPPPDEDSHCRLKGLFCTKPPPPHQPGTPHKWGGRGGAGGGHNSPPPPSPNPSGGWGVRGLKVVKVQTEGVGGG